MCDADKDLNKNFYLKNGYFIFRNLFHKDEIENILKQAKKIYLLQMFSLKLIDDINSTTDVIFNEKIQILFNNYNDIFLNCGKQCQHIIDLWKLSVNNKIIDIVKFFGIENPIICTRPVLFSNSKYIAKNDINHTVPPHQDWASMQGSINSIVVWVPLLDISQDLGSLCFVPKSHKLGLLSKTKYNSFGLVDYFSNNDFISLDFEQGDVLFFSAFLVHKSGNNITNNIRWSVHFRYNDLNEKTFIDRRFPNPYIYRPIEDYIHPDFDTKKEINYYLKNL